MHAVALHGLQVIPVAAFAHAGLPMEQRLSQLRRVSFGYSLVFAGTLLQALQGLSFEDLPWGPLALVASGLLTMGSTLFHFAATKAPLVVTQAS